MATPPTLQVTGKSGKVYTFYVYKLPVTFSAVGGVYMFTKILSNGNHSGIYVGIADDLSTRFNGHHKQSCIDKEGATHILAFQENDDATRTAAEDDLLAVINFPCNDKKN